MALISRRSVNVTRTDFRRWYLEYWRKPPKQFDTPEAFVRGRLKDMGYDKDTIGTETGEVPAIDYIMEDWDQFVREGAGG